MPEIIGVPETIARCVRVILTTPIGTVVLDRSFGVDYSILDQPMPAARALFEVEIIDKIRKYEPRVNVEEVAFATDPQNGVLIPKVVLSLVA